MIWFFIYYFFLFFNGICGVFFTFILNRSPSQSNTRSVWPFIHFITEEMFKRTLVADMVDSVVLPVCVHLRFQLFFLLNWWWINSWLQRQTQSRWNVRRRHTFLCFSVILWLWTPKAPRKSHVWQLWPDVSCCGVPSRFHLLWCRWNVSIL